MIASLAATTTFFSMFRSEDGSGVALVVQLLVLVGPEHQPLTHPELEVEVDDGGGSGEPFRETKNMLTFDSYTFRVINIPSWKLTAAQFCRGVVYSMKSEPSPILQKESLPLER